MGTTGPEWARNSWPFPRLRGRTCAGSPAAEFATASKFTPVLLPLEGERLNRLRSFLGAARHPAEVRKLPGRETPQRRATTQQSPKLRLSKLSLSQNDRGHPRISRGSRDRHQRSPRI